MKNYYDQIHELNIAKLRLKSLQQKRDLYFEFTQPGGNSFDEPNVMGGVKNNKFDIYVEKVEEINYKIKMVESEIIILKENLECMEKSLRSMKGNLEQIFAMRYIDGLSIKQICKKTHYSRPHIYRKLKIIRNIIKDDKK